MTSFVNYGYGVTADTVKGAVFTAVKAEYTPPGEKVVLSLPDDRRDVLLYNHELSLYARGYRVGTDDQRWYYYDAANKIRPLHEVDCWQYLDEGAKK